MFDRYRRWRHAGEENAVVMYNYSIGFQLAVAIVGCAILSFSLGLLSDSQMALHFARIAPALLFLVPVLAKRRIAIIFTEHDLIYRSALASPQRIQLRGVCAIKKGLI